ncbi:MAG TPA: ABC transporter substrate-binding protein, partial [Actinomycetota bacterium]|nr:ABC transporter substrate-binding protein [Actinomycetota bacterium]
MRRLKLLVPVVALMLIAAACAGDDDGDGGGGGDGETAATEPNTGTVNVLNAMEPNEGEAVQAAVDENLENADYAV